MLRCRFILPKGGVEEPGHGGKKNPKTEWKRFLVADSVGLAFQEESTEIVPMRLPPYSLRKGSCIDLFQIDRSIQKTVVLSQRTGSSPAFSANSRPQPDRLQGMQV